MSQIRHYRKIPFQITSWELMENTNIADQKKCAGAQNKGIKNLDSEIQLDYQD